MRYHLHCHICGRDYDPAEVRYACPLDGPLAVLEVAFDFAIQPNSQFPIPNSRSMWRYRALLPVADGTPEPAIAPGMSPLQPVRRLRAELGLPNLWLKDETRNPTASMKDRASSLCIAKARELGLATVSCASTGNAAASWAAVAAAEGLACNIFVPRTAPRAKVAQLLAYGARVFSVDGTYDEAFDLCIAASERFGWYNRNTGYNPYTVEGKKTAALEIAEQLDWRAPDVVIVPAGDGCTISGIGKGFRDLAAMGRIDRVPRLVAAQAQGSDAIKRALESDGQIRPITASTLADSISVGLPRVGAMAVRTIRDSGGCAVAVSDVEILDAQREMGRLTGIFAEPAAAASLAAAHKLAQAGGLRTGETVVLLVTGSGLKDVDAALRAPTSQPITVKTLPDVTP